MKAQKIVAKGAASADAKKGKKRFTATFTRPSTLKLARTVKTRRAVARVNDSLDAYAILRHPLNTESAMRSVEDNNTLVFICDVRANKKQIAAAVKTVYGLDAARVNTLIRPTGEKKAYVRLTPSQDAMEAATKIGLV